MTFILRKSFICLKNVKYVNVKKICKLILKISCNIKLKNIFGFLKAHASPNKGYFVKNVILLAIFTNANSLKRVFFKLSKSDEKLDL